jgi:hypothetical protein
VTRRSRSSSKAEAAYALRVVYVRRVRRGVLGIGRRYEFALTPPDAPVEFRPKKPVVRRVIFRRMAREGYHQRDAWDAVGGANQLADQGGGAFEYSFRGSV